MVDPAVAYFLNEFYETIFLSAVENNDELTLDRIGNQTPYNIDDTWKNVDRAATWLDQQYEKWLASKA